MARGFSSILLFFIVISSLRVSHSFAQSTHVPNGPPNKTYHYQDLGISIHCSDKFTDDTLTVTVRRDKKTIFKRRFENVEEYKPPVRISIDSLSKGFILRTWSGGAHCCETIFLALYDGQNFRLIDSLFISDGHFTFKSIDSTRKKIIAADIDHFPYEWTSFAGSEFNLSYYSIEATGFHDITAQFARQVMQRVRRFYKNIRQARHSSSGAIEGLELGIIRQNLACLLYAYISIGKESEGWEIVRKEYHYADKKKYFSELEENIRTEAVKH